MAEYDKALALDPGYAPAWAGLAVSLNFVADDEPTLEHADAPRRRSIEAAEKAVALAPDLADGWASRGFVRALVHHDWSGARADLEKAIALNPGDPHARRRLGIVLSSVGRIDEAIAVLTKAVELFNASTPARTATCFVMRPSIVALMSPRDSSPLDEPGDSAPLQQHGARQPGTARRALPNVRETSSRSTAHAPHQFGWARERAPSAARRGGERRHLAA